MPKNPIFNIEESLKKAERAHNLSEQLNDKEQEIEVLKQEIEELRKKGNTSEEATKLAELREELSTQGLKELSVDSIAPNPEQPRETFEPENIEILARSLQTDGQQQPILVIKRGEENYLIFDGERRWRAARFLGMTTILAIIIPEPKKLHRQALLANLHRENLNNLDLAEALIREISSSNDIPEKDIPRILNTVVKRLSKQKQMQNLVEGVLKQEREQENILASLELSFEEIAILKSILSLQLNPGSVNKNIFPTLELFHDLKEAIRIRGLSPYQALILQRVSPEKLKGNAATITKLRQKLTNEIIEQKLSVGETRKKVAELFEQEKAEEKTFSSEDVKKFVKEADKLDIAQFDSQELKSLKEFLLSKIEEIDKFLS